MLGVNHGGNRDSVYLLELPKTNYWKYISFSSGFLVIITTTAISIIFFCYGPISAPETFKIIGGYFLLGPLGGFDATCLSCFLLSLIMHVCRSRPPKIKNPVEEVDSSDSWK